MKNYSCFDRFVLRTPLFPFSFLENFIKIDTQDIKEFVDYINNKVFLEALFLASPNLHTKTLQLIQGEKFANKEIEKLKISLYKYISRASTRCTPFGLFAGISTGKFSETDDLKIEKLESYKKNTRLDMNFLCQLASELSKMPIIRDNINFFPNSSIYIVGEQIRYIEYSYSNNLRMHKIVSVENSEYIEKLLSEATHGAKISSLANSIVEDDITTEEATEFIHEIIESQLLVSELEPEVTGDGFFEKVIEIAKRTADKEPIVDEIIELFNKLQELDKLPLGANIDKYKEIEEAVKKTKLNFNPQYLLQTDMLKENKKLSLDKNIVNTLKDGLSVLNKLSANHPETNLSRFRQAFYKKFDEAEVPLLLALDTEIGVGYLQGMAQGANTPLLQGINVPNSGTSTRSINWNYSYSFLLGKYINAIKNNEYSVDLSEKEIAELPDSNAENKPATISSIVQIIGTNGDKQVVMTSAGGASAANLLGRFGHVCNDLNAHIKEIATHEEDFYKDQIIAEIVHLPEARTGNVLYRPRLHDFEIPYLAKPNTLPENQILPGDLMVSVKHDRVILRSKKLNKEIIPRLSNAHNFSGLALPVYQFLCDLQSQNIMDGIGFYWGPLSSEFQFLPRVTYKNLILSLASWNISMKDFQPFLEKKNDRELIDSLTEWTEKLKIPEWVLLKDGDNALPINFGNVLSVRTLISLVKNRQQFQIKELIHKENNAFISNEEGYFTNEFVFAFKKNHERDKVQS